MRTANFTTFRSQGSEPESSDDAAMGDQPVGGNAAHVPHEQLAAGQPPAAHPVPAQPGPSAGRQPIGEQATAQPQAYVDLTGASDGTQHSCLNLEGNPAGCEMFEEEEIYEGEEGEVWEEVGESEAGEQMEGEELPVHEQQVMDSQNTPTNTESNAENRGPGMENRQSNNQPQAAGAGAHSHEECPWYRAMMDTITCEAMSRALRRWEASHGRQHQVTVIPVLYPSHLEVLPGPSRVNVPIGTPRFAANHAETYQPAPWESPAHNAPPAHANPTYVQPYDPYRPAVFPELNSTYTMCPSCFTMIPYEYQCPIFDAQASAPNAQTLHNHLHMYPGRVTVSYTNERRTDATTREHATQTPPVSRYTVSVDSQGTAHSSSATRDEINAARAAMIAVQKAVHAGENVEMIMEHSSQPYQGAGTGPSQRLSSAPVRPMQSETVAQSHLRPPTANHDPYHYGPRASTSRGAGPSTARDPSSRQGWGLPGSVPDPFLAPFPVPRPRRVQRPNVQNVHDHIQNYREMWARIADLWDRDDNGNAQGNGNPPNDH